ncbi:MAG TPA: hypothetical protein V6D08_10680 [Candidatus Obscuribacterales bacterium]
MKIMSEQESTAMHSGLSSQQADPFDDAVTTLFGLEGQAAGNQSFGRAESNVPDPVPAQRYPRQGQQHDQAAPQREHLASIEDLIELFEHKHFTRQIERLLNSPDASGDQHNLELERAEQWAERIRARLRILSVEHLPVINRFADAVQIGDFKTIDLILESLKGDPAELGSLLTELWLSP